jgi:carbamoyltransferase
VTRAVLGLNAVFHESSAALLVDGNLVALVEEERINRVRHAKKARIENTPILPYDAIDRALEAGGIAFEQLEAVAYTFDPATRFAACGRVVDDPDVPPGDYGSPDGEARLRNFIALTPALLEARFGARVPIRFVPHHLSHMASAWHSSPWDESALLSIDGIGEDDTTSWGVGRGGRIEVMARIAYPHSLGFFWEEVTEYLGFRRNHDEGTVMALASFGEPARFRDAVRRILRPTAGDGFFVDHRLARFRAQDGRGLTEILGPRRLSSEPLLYEGDERRHADIAASLQEVTEEVLIGIARRVRTETGLTRLAIAGGVALNCVANARLAGVGFFEDVWIVPAANDAGTAFGAAAVISAELGIGAKRNEWRHAFVAAPDSADAIETALAARRLHAPSLADPELIPRVARLLADGHVVAWYESPSEVGPRALGHRSILADPTRPEMKDRLNLRVKHRLPFRPFAPIVRDEDADRYFAIPAAARNLCRFMLAAVPIKRDAQVALPAIMHIDGTTRPQLVDRDSLPRLHSLLGAFEELRGVPVLVNTSFNDREPIVGSPADALETFQRTEIDALVLGDRILVKAR